jgi:hypothetical protein
VTFRAVSGCVLWDAHQLDRDSVLRLLAIFERDCSECASDGDRQAMMVAGVLWAELHGAAVRAGMLALRPSLESRLDGASGFYVIGG